MLDEAVADLVTGVPTGFCDLDRLTKGFQPGELIVVAGRPDMGKTSFAVTIVGHVATQVGLPVAVFSMEMPAEQWGMRLMSSTQRIKLDHLRNGCLEDDELKKQTAFVSDLSSSRKVLVDDSSGLTITDIRSRARQYAKEAKQLGLIVIDYLQLMSATGKYGDRFKEIEAISCGLKSLAKELNCPILCLYQIPNSLEKRIDKHPIISDLHKSIEQNADLVLFLFREVVYNQDLKGTDKEHDAEVIIAKQSNGLTEKVNLVFFGDCSRFMNSTRIN